jgi:hypothetical protein
MSILVEKSQNRTIIENMARETTAWLAASDDFSSQAGRFSLFLFVIARTSAAFRCAVLLAGFSAAGRKTGR